MHKMYKPRDILYIGLFLLLVLALWLGLSLLPGPALVRLPPEAKGGYDLTGVNFTDNVYYLYQAWETWPEKLYTPDELPKAGPSITYSDNYPYATHRQTLVLAPGVTYGISLRSSDFAMRMFLDGEEIFTAGNPAATEAENVPSVRQVLYYFTPKTDRVEIVVQSSNYVHYLDGTKAPHIVLGRAENVAAHARAKDIKSGVIFGCLMTAFLYHLAVFLLNRRQRASLVFGLLCLLVGLVGVEGFVVLGDGMYWLAVYRLGYAATIFSLAGFVLLVDLLFPGALHKWVVRWYYAVCGAYLALALLAHTMVVTRVLAAFHAVSVAMILYLILRLAPTLRQGRLKNMLAFLGIALFGLFAVYVMLYRNGIGPALYINNQPVVTVEAGLVLLVACYAMVLAIQQAEVNRRLERAREQLAEAKTRYESLQARAKEAENERSPAGRLADFGLTKRENEVALLLLAGKSRAEITQVLSVSRGTVNTHCTNLYRKAGCTSVAELTRLVLPAAPGGPGSGENSTD